MSGEESHRTRAVYCDRASRLHEGKLGCMVASWKNIREKQKIIFKFVARLARKFQTVEFGKRHAHVFSLSPVIRTHFSVSVRSAGFYRICSETSARHSADAIKT